MCVVCVVVMGGSTTLLEVPVVYQDLRQPEALLQTIDALDQLNTAVDRVFGCIEKRIDSAKCRIGAVSQRLSVATAKVNHLSSLTSKATTVLSAAKYPAPKRSAPSSEYSQLKEANNKIVIYSLDDYRPLACDLEPVISVRSKTHFDEKIDVKRAVD